MALSICQIFYIGTKTSASYAGFSKDKQARILTREEGSRASAQREREDWKRARSQAVGDGKEHERTDKALTVCIVSRRVCFFLALLGKV